MGCIPCKPVRSSASDSGHGTPDRPATPQSDHLAAGVGGAAVLPGSAPKPRRHSFGDAAHVQATSASPRPRISLDDLQAIAATPPGAASLPFAALVGEQEAQALDGEFGQLHPPREKHGVPQVHPWEKTLNPGRVSIPLGNPKGVDLKTLLDLDAVKRGTLDLIWMIGRRTLIVGPENVVGHDEGTGKDKRQGHASFVEGRRLGRIAGELKWDADEKVFYVMPKSGRYCKGHEDRGPDQVIAVAKQFARCGLEVEPRMYVPAGHGVEQQLIKLPQAGSSQSPPIAGPSTEAQDLRNALADLTPEALKRLLAESPSWNGSEEVLRAMSPEAVESVVRQLRRQELEDLLETLPNEAVDALFADTLSRATGEAVLAKLSGQASPGSSRRTRE